MTITWTIEEMWYKSIDGFVIAANWRAMAADGENDEHLAFKYGRCEWEDGNVIIPYEQLTQDIVLGWVWESINKADTEANLASQLQALANPTSATGVPWQ